MTLRIQTDPTDDFSVTNQKGDKMIVMMHFGDGTWKEIDVSSDDPETAVHEAATWVGDNAFFEVTNPDTDETIATCTL